MTTTTLQNEQKISSEQLEEFIKRYSLEAHTLDINLRSMLYDFKHDSNKQGYLLFQNLDPKKSLELLVKYGSLLGTPFSYIQEGNGEFFHPITPMYGFEKEISSKSSKINLDFHTELAFHHFIPDYLMLFCVRGDRDNQAKTYVSSVRSSFSEISEELKEILQKPLFQTGIDHSFGNANTIKGNGKPVAVLYGDINDPLLSFDPDLMVALTDEADQALKELRAILYKNKTTLILQPGELVIIDNLRAVHGRSSFTPYYDGNDRFLRRCFVTRDLTRAQQVFRKKERIITYEF